MLLLAAVAGLLAPTCARAVGVGDRAPDFTLNDRDGRTTTLTDARGKVAIVDFWASWCMPCAPLLPALDAVAERHDGRVQVFAIDIDRSADKSDAFLREHLPSPSPFTHVLDDASAKVLARYGAPGMPALFVIDPDGVVRFVEVGYSREHVRGLEDAVRALLPSPAATHD